MINLDGSLVAQKNELKLDYKDIATRMSGYIGVPVSAESVAHYFARNSGIPMEKLGAFLNALEFKVVGIAQRCIPEEEHKTLRYLARKGFDALGDD